MTEDKMRAEFLLWSTELKSLDKRGLFAHVMAKKNRVWS